MSEEQLRSFLLFYSLSLGLIAPHMAVFYSAQANGMKRLHSHHVDRMNGAFMITQDNLWWNNNIYNNKIR